MTASKAGAPLLSLLGATIVGVVLVLLTGHNPVLIGEEFVDRVVLRRAGLEESFVAMTPILLAGLAALLAARVGLWNIGIDGQVAAGAITAAAIAPRLDDMPRVAMWGIAAGAGFLAGAAWAALPALLRARGGVNEIVTTIMMTYVAFGLVSWLIKGPLKDESVVSPATASIEVARRMPRLGDSRIHLAVILAIVLAIVVGVVLRWTVPGLLSRVVGEAPAAADLLTVPVSRYLLVAFLLSGAIAALAGVSEVLAVRGSVPGDWRPSLGLAAFAALFLARQHAIWLIPSSLLLGMMAYASTVLPRPTGLSPDFFPMIEGILLIFLSIGEWRRRSAAAGQVDEPVTGGSR